MKNITQVILLCLCFYIYLTPSYACTCCLTGYTCKKETISSTNYKKTCIGNGAFCSSSPSTSALYLYHTEITFWTDNKCTNKTGNTIDLYTLELFGNGTYEYKSANQVDYTPTGSTSTTTYTFCKNFTDIEISKEITVTLKGNWNLKVAINASQIPIPTSGSPTPTKVTFTGASIKQLIFQGFKLSDASENKDKYPPTQVTSDANSRFNSQIGFNGDGYSAAQLSGTFTMSANATLEAQFGNELILKDATVQGINGASWRGINVEGSTHSNGGTTVSIASVTSGQFPYLTIWNEDQSKWHQNVIIAAALYITGSCSIKDALGGDVIESKKDKISYDTKGGITLCGEGIIIAEGCTFSNTSIKFVLGQENYPEGVEKGISYFDRCIFENSPLRLNKIWFSWNNNYITTPTFYKCNFSNINNVCISGLNSSFYASTNTFGSSTTPVIGAILEIDDEYNIQNIVKNTMYISGSFGITCNGCQDVRIVYGNEISHYHNTGGSGIVLSGCKRFYVSGNKIKYAGTGINLISTGNYQTNNVSKNSIINCSYGATNSEDNSGAQYDCNEFTGSTKVDIVDNINKSTIGLRSQGTSTSPTNNTFSHRCSVGSKDFITNQNKLLYYYTSGTDKPDATCSNVTNTSISTAKSCSNMKLGDDTVLIERTPAEVKTDVQNAKDSLSNLPNPLSNFDDTVRYNYYTSQIHTLYNDLLTSYSMNYGYIDSIIIDSLTPYLNNENNIYAKQLMLPQYLKFSKNNSSYFDSAQIILDALSDSVSSNPSDTELVNFVNYWSIAKDSIDSTTFTSDSTFMMQIAHSSSSVAGNAKGWLQYHCEDMPEMISISPIIDTIIAPVTDSVEDVIYETASYRNSHARNLVKVDSTIYFGGVAIETGTAIKQVAYNASANTLYELPQSDTMVANFRINLNDTNYKSMSLRMVHSVNDTGMITTTDTLLYHATDSTNDVVSYASNHNTPFTIQNSSYTIPYTTVDNFIDTIWFHTTFVSDSQTYYSLDTLRDSAYTSTEHFTSHLPAQGYDSIAYVKTYYSIDSSFDSVSHFNSLFTTYYTVNGFKERITYRDSFAWKELFPIVLPDFSKYQNFANAGEDKAVCHPDVTPIGAAALDGCTYSWSPTTGLSEPTSANPVANVSETTTFILTATLDGFVDKDTVTVFVETIHPSPSFYATFIDDDGVVVFHNTTYDPNTNITWQWDFGDGSDFSTEKNPTHEYDECGGTYVVTLYASNVCDSNVANCFAVPPHGSCKTGSGITEFRLLWSGSSPKTNTLKENRKEETLTYSILSACKPNPANQSTTFNYQLAKGVRKACLSITNITGIEVLREGIAPNSSSKEINTSNLPTGIYSCALITDGVKTSVKKLVIQR